MKLMKRTLVLLLVLLALGASVAAYAFAVEPKLLTVRRYEGKTTLPVRIVQFSDTHLGESYSVEQLARLVEKINLQEPELVVFTGDLFDNYAKDGPREDVAEVLADIEAPLGKFAVWGNHDQGGGASRVYETVLAEAGFTLLTNETASVVLESGETLVVGGLDEALLGYADVNGLAAKMAESGADYKLLLLHEPDLLDAFPDETAALALAGHSHGGQIWLPLGAVVTPPLAKRYVRGFYETNGMTLYVSSGVGTSILPVRLGVVPELAVFLPSGAE